jgi:hypothetical protein
MAWRSTWLLWLAMLVGCSGGDPTATDPQLLYEDAFVTPPSQVEILAEGGTMVRGLDGWLKLQPGTSGLKLRYPGRFTFRDCGEPLIWFAKATAESGLASGSGSFVCQESVDPRFPFDNGRWLVTDRSSGYVYYRIWKHYRAADRDM